MSEFDAEATARFFNREYRQVDLVRGSKQETRLHPRDHILLKHILGAVDPPRCRVFDYGCGQARLLATMLERGFAAEGMEKHGDMLAVAQAETGRWAASGPRVRGGGIDELESMPEAEFDVFIAMGVFQYLPKAEYDRTLRAIARLLKPKGMLVATYQNALFDLFTFNKYTVDFLMQKLISPQLAETERTAIERDIKALIVNPDKPPYAANRARDNIFVHLTNPLTIDLHLAQSGFQVREKYFYEYFGLPPLIASRHEKVAQSLKSQFEVDNATAWQGHFMANAFLVQASLI